MIELERSVEEGSSIFNRLRAAQKEQEQFTLSPTQMSILYGLAGMSDETRQTVIANRVNDRCERVREIQTYFAMDLGELVINHEQAKELEGKTERNTDNYKGGEGRRLPNAGGNDRDKALEISMGYHQNIVTSSAAAMLGISFNEEGLRLTEDEKEKEKEALDPELRKKRLAAINKLRLEVVQSEILARTDNEYFDAQAVEVSFRMLKIPMPSELVSHASGSV